MDRQQPNNKTVVFFFFSGLNKILSFISIYIFFILLTVSRESKRVVKRGWRKGSREWPPWTKGKSQSSNIGLSAFCALFLIFILSLFASFSVCVAYIYTAPKLMYIYILDLRLSVGLTSTQDRTKGGNTPAVLFYKGHPYARYKNLKSNSKR